MQLHRAHRNNLAVEAQLASSSLRLYGHIIAGDLAAIDLFDDLQECAANLGIAERRRTTEAGIPLPSICPVLLGA